MAVTGLRERATRRRGIVSVWGMVALLGLCGMAALSIDFGCVYVAKQQLQNAADAAALAAAGRLRWAADAEAARADAVGVAQANLVLGQQVALDAQTDITFGVYDRATDEFTPGWLADQVPMVKVTARRTDGSPDGPVPLSFSRLFGLETVSVQATAIAGLAALGASPASAGLPSLRMPLELVILQDVSQSFEQELPQAKNADVALLSLINDKAVTGDRLGVVRFRGSAVCTSNLAGIPDETPTLQSTIQAIQVGSELESGTHTGAAIDKAVEIFDEQGSRDAEKVIVLVSDGMPNPEYRRPLAVAAADRAAAKGIRIHTVTFIVDSQGDADFNASLTRNGGYDFYTPQAEELDSILVQVGLVEIGRPRLVY